MKILKRVICIVVISIISLMIYSTSVKAAAIIKVTADALNLREEATTSSDSLTLLSEGDTCELIEEDGDWYKVKYETYTGYVSKEYVEKESSASQGTSNETEVNDNKTSESSDSYVQIIGKISKKTSLKLVPLIYSSEIDTLNNNEKIVILSEINGWTYIQTDTVTGWVRNDSIKDKQTISDNSGESITNDTDNESATNTEDASNNEADDKDEQASENTDNTTSENYEEKTMYVNDSYVNVRTEPNTSSEIIMVLALNTKLTVIGESGDWYKVSTSEGEAYVSKELLSSKQPTSSRGNTKKVVNNSSDNITDTTTKKETTTVSNESTSLKGQEIVNYARKFLGVPYVYGGASKSGFDCSGFTMYVYKKFGISIPHGAQGQAKLGKTINANKNSASSLKQNLQVGDLVFFLDYETMDEIGHVGIYIGDGEFIHASSGSGYCVKISNLLPGEAYNARYCGARRLI